MNVRIALLAVCLVRASLAAPPTVVYSMLMETEGAELGRALEAWAKEARASGQPTFVQLNSLGAAESVILREFYLEEERGSSAIAIVSALAYSRYSRAPSGLARIMELPGCDGAGRDHLLRDVEAELRKHDDDVRALVDFGRVLLLSSRRIPDLGFLRQRVMFSFDDDDMADSAGRALGLRVETIELVLMPSLRPDEYLGGYLTAGVLDQFGLTTKESAVTQRWPYYDSMSAAAVVVLVNAPARALLATRPGGLDGLLPGLTRRLRAASTSAHNRVIDPAAGLTRSKLGPDIREALVKFKMDWIQACTACQPVRASHDRNCTSKASDL